jgi:alpha-L-fucosidase
MKRINTIKLKSLTICLIISSFVIILFMVSCKSRIQHVKEAKISGKYPDQEEYLEWFKDAKFGMFIHWGPYSRLAGEWNGQQVRSPAEWIMNNLKIPVDEYRELAHKLNPVKFNAQEWVRLAKATGMKYIVITAKHHDGFAMYKSKVSSYNIVDWTPFKRDPLKELSQACAEEGIKFCVYYSHREDWDHPGGYGNNWDYDNDWGDDFYDHEKFDKYLEEKAKPQLRELLTNYGPIGLVWFDRGMYTPEQGKEFVKLVHDFQPATLINSRVGNYNQDLIGDYQSMSDNGMPPGGLKEYWESAQTLNTTWGFSKFDTLWKSPETVIRKLVEIVSRGGNYLLNIGPKGNGEIPDTTVEILMKVGRWVERNAESIYGTTANPFGELAWGYCTVKGSRLYLFVRNWPQDGVLIVPGLQNAVT